tara:strand:+ start:415 stop:609 length:195 start_codon:yes stop_codon:yes gene_type:complete
MNYETVQRESDDFIKFYIATRNDGAIFEVPCILDGNGDVDTTATQNKMDSHVEACDNLMSIIGE